MKKFLFLSLSIFLLASGMLIAEPAPDYYISKYEIMDLDFLRTHYLEINNGRPIQVDGYFSSYKWIAPFEYKDRLKSVGFDVEGYNVLQFTLKEKDDVHYSFPILIFHTQAGDLQEFEQLKKGDRLVIYGRFYNLEKSEYTMETDLVETIKKGGHDRNILVDARVAPTPTPTPTATPVPGPNLFQKLVEMVNPKETATPTGTITPEPGK